MSSKRLYIETFGCQMNVNDSERIVTMLGDLGYGSTDRPESADMILVNTCSVRGGAEEKVYRRLANLRVFKREPKRVIIGVGGCVAQQEGEELLKKIPWLDLVFGTHNLHLLPDMVAAAEQGERRCETAFIDNEHRIDLFPVSRDSRRLSSFVTVMQGCDNFCAYCIVPYVRGREISRRSGEILEEIERLADSGVREVVLLGQNVNSYGLKSQGEIGFAELVHKVSEIAGIQRIRFTTSHPKDMSPELIECFREIPSLCGQIQLPAQSGSDRILKAMNRGYTRAEYLEKIHALRKARPGIAITGDMIVGFPGESDGDFNETLSLMHEVGYADLFSFVYSPRPGTAASGMTEEIDRNEKLRRLELLQELQGSLSLKFYSGLLGTVQTVLVEGEGKQPGQVSGRADSGRIVNFPGTPDLIGQLLGVRITRVYKNSLLGELLR